MGSENSKLLVLAIEIGNEKSGFAFSENNKSSIIYTATDDTNRQIERIPTALLLKEDLSFDNFGFYAEEKYMSLSLQNEHSNYTFVNNIEICQIDDKLYIKDCKGNDLEAEKIYIKIIKHLLERCLRQTKRYTKFEKYEKSLTIIVPDNVCKELKDSLKSMIEDVKNVRFVSTLEAAAAYCVSQQFILGGETNTKKIENGTSFLLINFDGRSTTVCSLNMTSSDEYELLPESKIETGGDTITDIFFEDIKERYGIGENWNELRSDHFYDYMNLRRVFDNEKHKFNNSTECVVIEMPNSIIDSMNQNDDYSDESIDIKDKKLIIPKKTMKDYFRRSLTSLITTIQNIVKSKKEKIEFLLLFGGYSNSPIVREIIDECVGPIQIILVFEPDKGVLKGAVMLGLQANRVEGIYGFIRERKEKDSSIQITFEGQIAYFTTIFKSSQLKDRKSIPYELEFENGEPIVLYRIDSIEIATKKSLTEKDFEKVVPEIQPNDCVWNYKDKVEIYMKGNVVVFCLKMSVDICK